MGIPAPQMDTGKGGSPFLKVKDLAKKGRTKLTLLGNIREQPGAYGPQILMDVKNGTRTFTFAIKLNSGNHLRLFARFGKNEKRWTGSIQVERGEYLGKEYIKVCD